MGCIVELKDPSLQFEFNNQGSKQQILLEIMLKYGTMSIDELAMMLNTPLDKLKEILAGNQYFVGQQADDLSHIFLMFFGRIFFNKFTLIRNFF